VLDAPTLSDAEYDRLFRELEQLEADHPDLITPDSPTRRVGAAPSEKFAKVTHRRQMMSLANAMTGEEFLEFDARVHRLFGEQPVRYVGSPSWTDWRSRSPTRTGSSCRARPGATA